MCPGLRSFFSCIVYPKQPSEVSYAIFKVFIIPKSRSGTSRINFKLVGALQVDKQLEARNHVSYTKSPTSQVITKLELQCKWMSSLMILIVHNRKQSIIRTRGKGCLRFSRLGPAQGSLSTVELRLIRVGFVITPGRELNTTREVFCTCSIAEITLIV